MARAIRKKSGTGIYHVMLRGINRQDIFENEEDYQQMVSILRGQTERYDEKGLRLPPFCIFYGYCLMSNHIHLLIQEREEQISEIMKRIGVTYAHYFNKKYERNGHLFQDRFRSEPVDDIAYFVILLRYIHQNPLKAGIVGHIDDYSWSSWNEYKTEGNPKAFCSTRAVLSRISREELKELISIPVEGDEHILDIDTDGSRFVSDSDVKAFLLDSRGIANPLMVQSLEKTRRNEVLRSALSFGTGIRQLSRLTGVSFGVIQKLAK
jgi:REP element-mobilizing transposase RayT